MSYDDNSFELSSSEDVELPDLIWDVMQEVALQEGQVAYDGNDVEAFTRHMIASALGLRDIGSEFSDDDDDDTESENSFCDANVESEIADAIAAQDDRRPFCRFFALGNCKFGQNCNFSHESTEMQDGNTTALVVCPFFLKGNCRYGQNCRLSHEPQASSKASPETTSEDFGGKDLSCGICFEDVVQTGKKFGLLSCNHCFCLECLRKWRRTNNIERELTHSCPACRKPSKYIVPSRRFCVGEEKKQVVKEYKDHLANTDCKYFNGQFGSCSFGSRCFYAHRKNGVDVKAQDVTRRRRHQRHVHRRLFNPFFFPIGIEFESDEEYVPEYYDDEEEEEEYFFHYMS